MSFTLEVKVRLGAVRLLVSDPHFEGRRRWMDRTLPWRGTRCNTYGGVRDAGDSPYSQGIFSVVYPAGDSVP